MPDYTDIIASLMGGGLAGATTGGAYALPPITGATQFSLPSLGGGGGFGLPPITGASSFDLPSLGGGGGGFGLPSLGGGGAYAYPLAAVRNTVKDIEREQQAAEKAGTATKALTKGGRTSQAPVPADAANISLSGLGPGQRDEFMRRAMTLGLHLERETGIPAEAFAAMAANESNFGLAPGNIVGGVKALPGEPSVTLATTEVVNGVRVPTTAQFRASATALEGMRHVAQTLQSGRYAPLYQQLTSGAIDRDEFVRRVNAAGYATNPNWAQGEIVPLMGEASRYRAQAQEAIAGQNRAQSEQAITQGQSLTGEALAYAAAPVNNGYVFPVQGYRGKIDLHHGSVAGGSDIMAPEGTPVVAMRGGTVTLAGSAGPGGNAVQIQGDDGLMYYYAHLQHAPRVRTGQPVTAGTPLGGVGRTGNAAGTPPHLHIGIGPSIQTGVGPSGGTGGSYNAQALLQQAYGGGPP